MEKNRHIGELIVHWRDHTLTAKDINADMYMALTRAIAKIEKQALKLKTENHRSQAGSATQTVAVAPTPDGQLEASPRPPRIINARRYSIKPMTAEEAALRLSPRTRSVCGLSRCRYGSRRRAVQTQRWKLRPDRALKLPDSFKNL